MSNNTNAEKLTGNVVIAGATGGIGSALLRQYAERSTQRVFALSRRRPDSLPANAQWLEFDLERPSTIEACAEQIGGAAGSIDVAIAATGFLHGDSIEPEKDWSHIKSDSLERSFFINTIGPALFLRFFAPLLNKDVPSVIAFLSARVGSISDNRIGGWYAYRASKAALNQIIRTASVELARKNKQAKIVGLHPGTVETDLSAPFRSNQYKRFSPEESAAYLVSVLDGLATDASGKVFDWQGEVVPE